MVEREVGGVQMRSISHEFSSDSHQYSFSQSSS
jgi:hypothetical protein